jgi:soluble lytic murein transglycosylase-like protein
MRRMAWLIVACCIEAAVAIDAQAASQVVVMIGGTKNDDELGDGHSVVMEFATAARAQDVSPRVLAFAPVVDEAARRTQIDRALLMAVIDVESGGNPQAVSPKGARGLMQLMPQTGLTQGAADLFDPHQNIDAGARLLRTLLATFGDLPLALAAFNAGEGAVHRYGDAIPPYAETVRYVQRVLERLARYRLAANTPEPAREAQTKKNPAEPGF